MSDARAEWAPLLEELARRRAHALAGGRRERIEREHARGRLTARERITRLVDPDTFLEFGMLATTPDGDGSAPSTYLCGLAEINGEPVAVGAEDFTIQAGSAGVNLHRFKGGFGGFIEELALGYRIPLVLLIQSAGGTIELQDVKGYATLLAGQPTYPMFELLEQVPVVAAVLGPAAGGSAARAVATHFTVMSRPHGCLFAGGPPLVKRATGVDVDKLTLGGSAVHVETSGLIANAAEDEEEAFDAIRSFLWYLPSNVDERPPRAIPCQPAAEPDTLLDVVPPDSRRPFDPRLVLDALVDGDSFFELAPDFGRSLVTGLARIDGYAVGVLASDSRFFGGALDADSSRKQISLVELCDEFHLPLVYVVDVPGFMIGPDAERGGVLGYGTRALQAIQRASVPVYTLQVRRSYGLAANATGNAHANSVRIAWPSAEWGDMPVSSGIEAEFREQIEGAEDPEAERRRILEQYAENTSMWRAAEHFAVEHVIDPRESRDVLARLLALAARTPLPSQSGPKFRV
ncbi:propionyl-CoA carboxylase subunit beta [Nocardioides sp. AN3]